MAFGLEDRQTIFALASGPGKSAVSVIRLSGPASSRAISLLVGRVPEPRKASLSQVIDPIDGSILDHGLVIWFPGPRSFTGEDCAELQVHGSRSVVAAVLASLSKIPGLRLAAPGEFARRALINGKLDLPSVEALGDLINAETDQQRRLAIRQMSGELSNVVQHWRSELISLLVLVEAELDFSDEHDAPARERYAILAKCTELLAGLGGVINNGRSAERLREGLAVLIAGPPNAGKSTLLNAIAKRDVAIVTDIPGTTRDLIELQLDLGGYPVTLIDTAGIRDSSDPVERIGIVRALRKAENADLILWLRPTDGPKLPPPGEFHGKTVWIVDTKIDIIDHKLRTIECDTEVFPEYFKISAEKGENVEAMIAKLQDFAGRNMNTEGSLATSNERQRTAVSLAYNSLAAAIQVIDTPELFAEELRQACFALEMLIGKVGVEDVLDQIFSRFCIGK